MGKATQQNTVSKNPGDWVLISWKEGVTRWSVRTKKEGFLQSDIIDFTTMKIEGHPTWIHISRVKPHNSLKWTLYSCKPKILNSCSKTALDRHADYFWNTNMDGKDSPAPWSVIPSLTWIYWFMTIAGREQEETTLPASKQISVQQEFISKAILCCLVVYTAFPGEGQGKF